MYYQCLRKSAHKRTPITIHTYIITLVYIYNSTTKQHSFTTSFNTKQHIKHHTYKTLKHLHLQVLSVLQHLEKVVRKEFNLLLLVYIHMYTKTLPLTTLYYVFGGVLKDQKGGVKKT